MISNKTIELVKSNDLFKGLDFNSLNIPFDARNFQEYKEGDLIYSSGEPSEFVCLLINGEVKIKLKSVKRLFFKSANDFFGETDIQQNESRNSSALANSDCLIYKLEADVFTNLFGDSISDQNELDSDVKQELTENPDVQTASEPIEKFVDVDINAEPAKVDINNLDDIHPQYETSEELNKIEIPNYEQEPNEIPVTHPEPEPMNTADVNLRMEPEKFDLKNIIDTTPKYETKIDIDKFEIPHYEQEPDLDAFIQQKYLENDNKSLKSNMIDDPNDMTNWIITEGSLEEVSEMQSRSSASQKSEAKNNNLSQANRNDNFGNKSGTDFSFTESSDNNNGLSTISESDLNRISKFLMQDVKAPLLTVRHYSSILSRFDLPEEVKRVISLISAQTNSVIDLLQASIDFSEKNTKTKFEEVSFNEVMNDNLTFLSDYVESRNVKLFKKLGEDVKIKIDTRKFYVACYYIARFICDMSKHGGNLYFSSQADDRNVVLTIKDENIINSNNLLEVFNPGFKNNSGENAGLSMAIAKFIIESMNSSITLQNEKSGTSYLVSIPISS